MKTDKKKLLKKVIAVSLLASMAVMNQMSYVAPMAYAFTEDTEAKLAQITATHDISALAESFVETPENGGIISINITQAGTYLFKGTNYNTDGACYIDVQVTVAEGVTANLIFDGLEIANKNGFHEDSSGNISVRGVANSPFVINGTANVYIKSDSVLTADKEMYGNFFSGDGTVNFMESENGAMLTTDWIDTTNIGVHGAYLDAGPSGSFKMTDGYCGSTDCWLGADDVITGGYCTLHNDYISYPTDGNGHDVYRSTLEGLPADTKVVSYNGNTYSFTYTDADGKLITFLPDLTQSGLAIAVGDEVYLYEADDITSDTNDYSATIYTFSDPTPLVDGIKLTKEYGDSEFGLTVNDDATVDENVTALKVNSADPISETDTGEYSTNAEISFTYGGQEYTMDIEVPVEITAKELTATITAEDKVYDKSSEVDVEVSFEGLVGSDTLTAEDYTVTAEFDDADGNVGTEKTVTAVITLSDDITNYTLANNGEATATADITAKDITVKSATVSDKVYDGTTDATVTAVEFDGVIDGDVVDYTATGAFADKNAGEDKAVTGTVTLKDTETNYKLTDGKFSTTADITEKGISVAEIKISDKTYDGTTKAIVESIKFEGVEEGIVITEDDYEITAVFDDKNAGEDKTVTVTITLKGQLKDYALEESVITVKADIAKAKITIDSIISSDKLFDGKDDADIADVRFKGSVASDKITYTATGKFDSAEIGADKTVTATITLTGDSAKNYEFDGGKATVVFTQKTDSDINGVSGVADDKDSVFTYKSAADKDDLKKPVSFTQVADISGETSFTYVVDEEGTYDIYFVYKKKIADLGNNDVATIYAALSEDGYMTREMSTSDYFTKVYFGDEVYEVEEGYGLFIYRILDVPDKYTIYVSEDVILSDEA
ncbi:MAG: hypothetical protein IJZ47_12120 [Oscillospiraceae bacterium]|nr:hypothetical protein [Oscillospiraceae bacterium]